MQISLVVPNRNNLKYFKWSYDSIRKNQGNHEVWICSAVDACNDGTLEWYEELAKNDPYFKYIVNNGPERLGHTILYNKIVDDLVETDLAMIWHCDMYLCPEALDEIEKLMYEKKFIPRNELDQFKLDEFETDLGCRLDGMNVKFKIKKRIASLTRIEPPLHPSGYEKILAHFGTEPEDFDEVGLLTQLFVWKNLNDWKQIDLNGNEFYVPLKGTTAGVFAPWAFWVDEFKKIGGHDFLYAPQSKEDDDIWNRFLLNGVEFVQTREGYCYHMTCRGSRFNPFLTEPGKSSEEWEIHNQKSTRNYIRKWGTFIHHENCGKPIVSPRFNIGFNFKNLTYDLLYLLEPWCDSIMVESRFETLQIIAKYKEMEKPNTKFNLDDKFFLHWDIITPEIQVEIDGQRFGQQDWEYIQNLSEIINQSGEIGEFELGNLKIKINAMNHYEQDLIICKNESILLDA